ncbi:MAG: hypothetical protein IPO92_15220 [Saprospiraceae bacterium]|nr:hypothetical protein [Saprospiraceae bacterium]
MLERLSVCLQRNNVNHWEPFINGLPPVPVSEIELWPSQNQVYISTFGQGIWLTTAYSTCMAVDNITGQVNGSSIFQAANTLNSNQIILGGEGTNVKYTAGSRIVLQK